MRWWGGGKEDEVGSDISEEAEEAENRTDVVLSQKEDCILIAYA